MTFISLSWQLYVTLGLGTCSSHTLKVGFFHNFERNLQLELVHFVIELVSDLIDYPSLLQALLMPHVSSMCLLVFFSLCYQVHYCYVLLYVQGKYHLRVGSLQISSYISCFPSLFQLFIISSVAIIRYVILVSFLCQRQGINQGPPSIDLFLSNSTTSIGCTYRNNLVPWILKRLVLCFLIVFIGFASLAHVDRFFRVLDIHSFIRTLYNV